MNANQRKMMMLALCGCAAGIAQTAAAQPRVINISGATLLENFVSSVASTNDFIDCDNDGIVTGGGIADQLSPSGSLAVGYPGAFWVVQYRVAGSVEGFQELVSFGATDCRPGMTMPMQTDYVTTPGGTPLIVGTLSRAFSNRVRYINNGATEGPANLGNPGAAPVTSEADDTYVARPFLTGTGMGGGIQIDISPLDVPTVWAVKGPTGSITVANTPAAPGYGRNPRLALNSDGTTASGANGNQLVDLGPRRLASVVPPPYPDDSNTIFEKNLAWAPIAALVNFGVGRTQIRMSDLRYLEATGRSICGENLTFVTRDVGSGTRNGFNNTTCIDPSMAVGENVGARNTNALNFNVGRSYLPSNKGGSGQSETTTQNTRLGIGYSGAERAVNGSAPASWGTGGRLELLAIQNDLYPGVDPMTAPFVRPNENTTVDNDAITGYVVGGPATLATIGDPDSEPVMDGGLGETNPRMCNTQAACYLNNICRSIDAFVSVPGGADTFFTPAERLAQQFLLFGSTDFLPGVLNPCVPVAQTPIASLQAWERSFSTYNNAFFNSFGTITLNGIVPVRTALTGTDRYSDGVALGANYLTQGGVALGNGTSMPTRNRIAGDFDGNGLRNCDDANQMLRAWNARNGGPAWVAPAGSGPIAGAPGNDACMELLGDFNNDGDFARRWDNTAMVFSPDFRDVRYWADGLGVDPVTGKLNRCVAFTKIDTEWLSLSGGADNNFFNTTLATGVAYTAGDSVGDVAGPTGLTTPGYAPIGADGVINAFDIDYVYKQFLRSPCVTDGVCNWGTDINEASCTDLSADINGDLIIDINDICKLVNDILGTRVGDVDLNGTIDAADLAIANGSLGMAGGWAMGDVDGDGTVTAADITIITAGIAGADFCNPTPACPGDVNGDGMVGLADIAGITSCWNQPASCNPGADQDGNGVIGLSDIALVTGNWAAVCP